ncbi:MAG: transglutaminase-like domain-containing protein [Bacteroidota bacterium]
MIKKLLFTLFVLLNIQQINAQNRTTHFITDAAYREQVNKAFEALKPVASGRSEQLFSVFTTKLSLEEEEALKFLYAYMPLSDLADYDGNFFLKQIRIAILTRTTFSWGKTIPEEIFRHFVLPYRINNENLDSSRVVFFNELKDRIKDLSMHDAALEVNHWCHEKVTYKGTDGRTSAPLSTVRTAYGRCGEESTFTVTALRAVGIPARQVYTPRWAHCDDNHAWVEVWVDGKWHFLGACEPESDLDIAWFSAPVLRAMLCNTTVYGNYKGPEEQLKSSDNFTQINLIENYAPSKKLFVKAIDKNKKPLTNATVEFQLYNYAEFYPLAKKRTDDTGLTSLITGLGDLMIWVYSGNKFGFQKVTIENTDTAVIVVDQIPDDQRSKNLIFVPPVQRQPKVADENGKAQNDIKLKNEDKIRADYEATFIDSVNSCLIAKKVNLNSDTVWMYLKQSRGNWPEISRFIITGAELNKTFMYNILDNISQKDLRDTPSNILLDHLQNSNTAFVDTDKIPIEFFYKFVLNPRISGEILSGYKGLLLQKFDNNFIAGVQKDPSMLIKYINDNIKISPDGNYSRNPLTPIGTYNLKYADIISRDIYFVALCRSFGVPAQIDPATKVPEYFKDSKWHEVYFDQHEIVNTPKGTLIIQIPEKLDFIPTYYTHFTIAKFSDGVYRSLDYEESNIFNYFPAKLTIDTGSYMIVTGIRGNDGSVNTHLFFFKLGSLQEQKIILEFNTKEQVPESIGKIDLTETFTNLTTKDKMNLNSFSHNKGMVLAWIDPDREPTKHSIVDFQQLKEQFEKWNGGIVFLVPSEINIENSTNKTFLALPSQSIFGIDNYNLLNKVEKSLGQKLNGNYPVFLLIDKVGNIIDMSYGYKIGRGEQIVKMLKYLN